MLVIGVERKQLVPKMKSAGVGLSTHVPVATGAEGGGRRGCAELRSWDSLCQGVTTMDSHLLSQGNAVYYY